MTCRDDRNQQKEERMSRVEPLHRDDLPADMQKRLTTTEQRMGFLPNSTLILARKPAICMALGQLAEAVNGPDMKLPRVLRALIANIASRSAGCQYCVAHSANGLGRAEVEEAKIAHVWEYETYPAFTDAERAALRVAQSAAAVPNAVTDEDFAELRKYYDDEEIVELVAVVAYFGWLNRFNDTMATELEPMPIEFAERVIAPTGWQAGKHAPGPSDRDAAK